MMDHPLVVRIRDGRSGADSPNPAVVTDFVENGSLADHLPGKKGGDLCQLNSPTRIVRILAGIALAMRFIHSRGVIHGNLTPGNVLMDWDFNVRICGFGHSVSPHQPKYRAAIDPGGVALWPDTMSRYAAPETYDDTIVPENDVFSFGMILYELIIERPMFPQSMKPYHIMKALVHGKLRLDIPDTVFPATEELIRDCLALDYRNRPSFTGIVEQFEAMEFKLMEGVKSVKNAAFVAEIEKQEM
jgi:serine/threonine protein kinase